MNRLYQWLSKRASFFRSDPSGRGAGRGASRTVRTTEVTVERRGLTLLVGDGQAPDVCPLCKQKLAPAQAEQAKLLLQDGFSSREAPPLDGTSS